MRFRNNKLYKIFTCWPILVILALLPVDPSHSASCKNLFDGSTVFQANFRTSLVKAPPQAVTINNSSTYNHPLLEMGRKLKIHSDFKYLSDLLPKRLSKEETQKAIKKAEAMKSREGDVAYVRSLLNDLFFAENELLPVTSEIARPRWTIREKSPRSRTVDYIENLWGQLIKRTPKKSSGSLIPLPYPILVPGSRFQEAYYWDSYFAIQALIKTGRLELATMQVENFLFMIENYGLVPNGTRTYYLTRSQPPLLASMIRTIIEAHLAEGLSPYTVKEWLYKRALPLVERDYSQFWMNPESRFDVESGLNHHWDSANSERPERHSSDKEELLGLTYRDVRAEAESGKDFTEAFQGEATQVAGVLLNSVMHKLEVDLAWLYRLVGSTGKAKMYETAAARRRQSMNRYLWDPVSRTYRDFHLKKKERLATLTADVFTPLWAGAATAAQAQGVRAQLSRLEQAGGIAASDVISGKQWDSPFGWAPHQYFAIDGLRKYGYAIDSQRIAQKFVSATESIHNDHGVIFEKIDVINAIKPEEVGNKYETQEGFLWTNSVYLWALTDILNQTLEEVK